MHFGVEFITDYQETQEKQSSDYQDLVLSSFQQSFSQDFCELAKVDGAIATEIVLGIISTAVVGTVADHATCRALETNIVALRAALRSTAARENVFARLQSVKSQWQMKRTFSALPSLQWLLYSV